MKKLLFLPLLVLTTTLFSQCDPDKMLLPSATLEVVSDWGVIAQVGLTGWELPFSAHVGLRIRDIRDSSSTKLGTLEPSVLPRLELDLRLINWLHVGLGLSEDPDIYVLGSVNTGERTKIFGRCLYDGSLRFSIGTKFIFYKQ